MREKIENFIAMSGATLLIAVGTYFFKFPNNFTFGGITGLAVLIAKTGLISLRRLFIRCQHVTSDSWRSDPR